MTYERDEVLPGLTQNTAASSDVLLRLLHPEAKVAHRWLILRPGLPADVVDAIVTHADWRVRGGFAESRAAAPADRARLVDDPEPKVRAALAYGPQHGTVDPLPDETYARLLADPEPEVREWVAQAWFIPQRILIGYAGHADAGIRRKACGAWDALAPHTRDALLADGDAAVRRAAALRACPGDAARTDELLADAGKSERLTVLERGRLTRATAEALMDIEDAYERQLLARNPSLPPDLVARLATDPDHEVRRVVSARPELTEEQRAAIDYTVERSDGLRPLPWVLALDGDSDELRACADSAHRWLRRSAAAHPSLPADLVERLAQDEDFPVRLMICQNQPDAPAEVLLRTVLEWDGYPTYDMPRLPRFPRKGLARYADDADPARRRLAVHDPDASAELVERLSRDESSWVRKAVASDPRLTRARIEELLRQSDTAWRAASNPALPVPDMHRLLDRLGIPA